MMAVDILLNLSEEGGGVVLKLQASPALRVEVEKFDLSCDLAATGANLASFCTVPNILCLKCNIQIHHEKYLMTEGTQA